MIGLVVFIIYWVCIYRKKQEIALLFLFLQVTGCFQIVPLGLITLDPIITKPFDWLSITLILHLAIFFVKIINSKRTLTLAVKIFLLYLVCLLVYSVTILRIEPKVSISVFRSYLFFLSPVIFVDYSAHHIQKSFKLICLFTVIASFIFILQSVAGTALLATSQVGDSAISAGASGLSRFYNLPYYAVFAALFYGNQILKKFNFLTFIYIGILFGAILVSFNRNTLVVTIISLIAIFFHNRKFNVKNLILVIIIAAIFIVPVAILQSDRVNSGTSDIQAITNLSRYSDPSNFNPTTVSTTEYRILHFKERYNYIRQQPISAQMFGIGLVNDQSYIINSFNFRFGVAVAGSKKDVSQVDTGDIVWSLLIMQTGIIGILLFLGIFFSYILFFFRYRVNDIPFIAVMYMGSLLATSFFSVEIISAPVVLLFSMIYILTVKLSLQHH